VARLQGARRRYRCISCAALPGRGVYDLKAPYLLAMLALALRGGHSAQVSMYNSRARRYLRRMPQFSGESEVGAAFGWQGALHAAADAEGV